MHVRGSDMLTSGIILCVITVTYRRWWSRYLQTLGHIGHPCGKVRGGWPRLIMHAPRDDVITAIEQDGRDRLEVIFKQLGLPGKAAAV